MLSSVSHSQTVPTSPGRSIESYIAPSDVFPPESNYAGRAPAALSAFNKPNGSRVGEIKMQNPACVNLPEAGKEAQDCTFPPVFVYQPVGNGASKTYPIELAEWAYETLGIPSYAPTMKQGKDAWSRVEYPDGHVWVKTLATEVRPYEDVAYLVNEIDRFCLSPGDACTKATAQDEAEMKRLAPLVSCYDNPYTVVDRVTKSGKRYYKLDIDNLSFAVKTKLPRPIYMPTHKPDGSNAGSFFSRGC